MAPGRSKLSMSEKYNRIVVLIDMDCFYCQVEELLDPVNLSGKPIGERITDLSCSYIEIKTFKQLLYSTHRMHQVLLSIMQLEQRESKEVKEEQTQKNFVQI